MATWRELVAHITKTYHGVEERDGRLLMVFAIEVSGRTQVLHVACQRASDGTEWAHVISPVGRCADVDLRRLLGEIAENISGGAVVIRNTVAIRQSIHLPSFNVSGFQEIAHLTAMQADFAELGHVGVDEF